MRAVVGVLGIMAALTLSVSAEAQRRPKPRPRAPMPKPMPLPQPGGQVGVQKIVVQLNDVISVPRRGLNTVIKLKQLINQQHGRTVNLQNAQLVSAVLVAKSAAGHGSADLMVGNHLQDRATVPQGNMQSNRPVSFSRIKLNNLARRSTGAWQIKLNGRIKTRKVIVNIRTSRLGGGGGRGPLDMVVGSANVSAFGSGLKTFNARGLKGNKLIIEGLRGAVNVIRAEVELLNGRVLPLHLRGIVRAGQQIQALIPNTRAALSKILVTAVPAGRQARAASYQLKIGI